MEEAQWLMQYWLVLFQWLLRGLFTGACPDHHSLVCFMTNNIAYVSSMCYRLPIYSFAFGSLLSVINYSL